MINKTILDNGLRIVTKRLENTKSVTVLVLAGAGSRYETKEINGISHFLEHMFFKGAKKFKNTKEVSEAIDSIGGDFNAFTAKEYAGYYVKVARDHMEVAMDVLSDMLLHARFDTEEIERERGVILEELNMYQDTPMYQIGWNFEQLIYGEQPMGWDQIGTKELIKSVTQEDFQKYKNELYTPDNTVISIVGDVDHDEIVEVTQKFFDMGDSKKTREFLPTEVIDPESHKYIKEKKTEQAHLMVGTLGVPYRDEDEWTMRVLAALLGGNMSSRMFLNVREAQGLAYYIRTETDHYTDTGTITTRAGVDVTRIQPAIDAIVAEYERVKTEDLDEAEVTKSKEYMKGKIILRLEDSEEYAHMIGRQELLLGSILSPDEIIAEIDKVTSADIQRLAREVFVKENLYLSVIGPYKSEELTI